MTDHSKTTDLFPAVLDGTPCEAVMHVRTEAKAGHQWTVNEEGELKAEDKVYALKSWCGGAVMQGTDSMLPGCGDIVSYDGIVVMDDTPRRAKGSAKVLSIMPLGGHTHRLEIEGSGPPKFLD